MLIFRYLAKEVCLTFLGFTCILIFIFMSNELVNHLNVAVEGRIPFVLIMKVMMLELPLFLSMLLPLGFYLAVLVVYGRLYAESEMTVLQACGYGPGQLLRDSLMMATVIVLIELVMVLWMNPNISAERTKLLQTTGIQTMIQSIAPGRFHAFSGGRDVFYVGAMDRSHTHGKHIFLVRMTPKDPVQWDVLWAEEAYAKTDPKTHEDYLILQDGKKYQGLPGQANYQIVEFNQMEARLPHPVQREKDDIRTYSTGSLWAQQANKRQLVELEWRFSVVLMVLILTLIAVPLSRVNPRAGKYAKLLPAIVFFIIYANFMFMVRRWLDAGFIRIWLGLWWLHLLVVLFAVFLMWRNRVTLA